MAIQALWIDGSFISQKPNPADVDVVMFVDATFLRGHYQRLDDINQQYPALHIVMAQHYAEDTSLHKAINQLEKEGWISLFGHTRDGDPKSFVSLSI